MKYFFSLLLLLYLQSTVYSAYIDQRDLSYEQLTIQRLLGQLEATQMHSTEKSDSSTATLLSVATAGLVIAAVNANSYHNHYHRSYYDNFSHRPSHIGSTVGVGLATSGILGAISSSIAAESKVKQKAAQQNQEEIKKNISSIISNLIVTDTDYITQKKDLQQEIATDTDKKILKISRKISNDIQILKNEEQDKLIHFNKLTNKLTLSASVVEADITKYISYNIDQMNKSNTSVASVKELKKLNKELTKQKKVKVKELQKQIKNHIKEFNRSFPKLQEETSNSIITLEDFKNQQVLSLVESATTTDNDLFQTFKSRYIQKLSAY